MSLYSSYLKAVTDGGPDTTIRVFEAGREYVRSFEDGSELHVYVRDYLDDSGDRVIEVFTRRPDGTTYMMIDVR